MSQVLQSQQGNNPDKTAILMATYNGQVFLEDQLESICRQTHQNWAIYASDDGSLDNTVAILKKYQSRLGEQSITFFSGNRKGFCQNFLSMVYREDIVADYYAFCDQDDVWENDRLEKAIDWLKTIPTDTPAVYCSRTELVDKNADHIGYSPLYPKKPMFSNAIVQSIAGGNTMVFNHAARTLVQEARHANVSSHDWWIYILVTACGGVVHYDQTPSLRYRQHGCNLKGMNKSLAAKWIRVRKLGEGRFRQWNDENIAALMPMNNRFTAENQRIFDWFVKARKSWLFPRLICFYKAGIHRQRAVDNVALLLAAIVNKI